MGGLAGPPNRPSEPWWAWSCGRARCARPQCFGSALPSAAGVDARDAMWNRPDLMPSAADLDEPAGFIDRIIGGDIGGIDFYSAIAEFDKSDPPEGGSTSLTDGPVDS